MPCNAPPNWRDKVFTRDQLAQFAGVSRETVYGWTRLSQAAGNPYGEPIAGRILYDRHDLYRAGILGGLHSLGIGIGPAEVAQVNEFAEAGEPGAPFTRVAHCRHAAAMVEAKVVWECAEVSAAKTLVSPNA